MTSSNEIKLRRHGALLGLFFLAWLAVVWGLAAYLQPLDGDLTRVGGYTENDYHWRSPQRTFEKNHFRVASGLADYDRYYDVVLLGDSFSCDQEGRRFGWQNYLFERTGWSILTLDVRRVWAHQILESEAFRKHPPRVFIFESVERYLYDRTSYFTGEPEKSHPVPRALPQLRPQRLESGVIWPRARSSWDTDYAIGYLNALMERKLGLNRQTLELPLTDGGLFSNRESRSLLVYFDEAGKPGMRGGDSAKMRAGMLALQEKVEQNGVTRFVCVVAPDKTSLYARWLANPASGTKNLVEAAAAEPRLNLVRTDLILGGEVLSGSQDVYLPDDSHWGSATHGLVANRTVDYLLDKEKAERR